MSARFVTRALVARLPIAIAIAVFSTALYAAEASCTQRADEKKLAGAARTSFLKKCEGDARAACEATADTKKLAGAARNSFVKKCATAPAPAVGGAAY